MSGINFVDVDAESLKNQLIQDFESALGETFYPGDERRIFLLQILPLIVGLKNDINESAKQNLLRYARGSMLDALGEFYNTPRLQAQKATVTLRFTLSGPQAMEVIIPKGTRATPDGNIYFATNADLVIPPGQITGDITAVSTEAGAKYNDYAPGQIKTIVDPVPYVASVTNIDTSSGGADIEPDDDGVNIWSRYRERIRLAPESFSVAGPEGAYIYWAKTADANIIDVSVSSPSAGTVKVVPLLKDGEIPSQAILDKVSTIVSSKDKRPLTDNVQVAAPTTVSYDITLTYYIALERQTEETIIRNAIEGTGGAIDQYKSWQAGKLGRAVNPDYLRQLILNAGAFRIDIISPMYIEINPDQVAKAGTVTVTYGGLI
ncbi:baseplate assembly protein [Calorimonas adulescens]|uniref:Baseplate J/gp47 family protein n=1 Tax=Calorimonas adulescens TaxID=2606906 RepID=A0A5D8QFG5_9THEO|nr:baseplate J/gp47 family protein [Calorimonas adulescens]TZE82008.1 baseplate J/gp47 family protein [Calorimonas adulescens]